MTLNIFVFFINELLLKLEEKNLKNMIIICDNVPFHKAAEVRRIVKTVVMNLFFYHLIRPPTKSNRRNFWLLERVYKS